LRWSRRSETAVRERTRTAKECRKSQKRKPSVSRGLLSAAIWSWWRRRELNPRPRASRERPLHAQPLLSSRPAASRRGKTAAGQPRIEFADPSGEPDRLHPLLASATETRRVRFSSHRHCALITQRERDCCYWQLSFFTFFTRWVRPRHATFRVLVPVEAVSPPGLSPRSIGSKIRIDGNTGGGDIFRAAAERRARRPSTTASPSG